MKVESFVPRRLRCQQPAGPPGGRVAWAEGGPGALLFLGVSGFSQLMDLHTSRGRADMEALTRALNSYFGRLIDIVVADGGDVIGFAGDALLATWGGDEGVSLAESTHRAAACALRLQVASREASFDGIRLTMRVAVCAGDLRLIEIGGERGRWSCLLGGTTLRQMKATTSAAQPGQVVCSGEAWAHLSSVAQGAVLPGQGVVLGSISPAPPVTGKEASAVDAATVRPFVPHSVQRFLDAGAGRWLADLRPVSTLFVSLPPIDWEQPGWTDRLQDAVRRLQRVVYRYEGALDKVLADEKGVTLIAAWGVPEAMHEDDSSRAVRAALEIHAELLALGFKSSVGVTRGQAFCGVVGNDHRSEFTLLGRSVNLAARLMQVGQGRVLCDAATVATAGDIEFQEQLPVIVKGMEAPIPVAVPIRRRNDDRDSARFSAAIVGRDGELAAWKERLREPALLAYHATRAAAWPEALTWLVRAGMQAMAQGASRAALRHLGEAVDIAQRTGTDGGDRLGLWRATMTDAEFRLGNMDGVVREGRLGLQVLGCPLPETTGAMMWTLVRLLFGRWWFGRTTAQLRRVVDEGDRVDRLVLIFERLTDAFGFKLDLPASIVSLQSWLHLAERHQRTGPLSLAWLMAFFWIAPTPMVARGRPWLRRARELARGVSDPTYRGTVAARAGLADLDVHDWESAEASASAVSVPSARCHRVCGGRLGLKRDGSAPGPTGRRPGLVRTRCGRPFSVLEPVPGPW